MYNQISQNLEYITEVVAYDSRKYKGIRGAFIFCSIIFIIAYALSKSIIAMQFPLIAFFVYALESISWSKYYMQSLTINQNTLVVKYLTKDTMQVASAPTDAVKVNIAYVWYKVKPPHPYLKITLPDNITIKQHQSDYWDVAKFKEIVTFVKQVQRSKPN